MKRTCGHKNRGFRSGGEGMVTLAQTQQRLRAEHTKTGEGQKPVCAATQRNPNINTKNAQGANAGGDMRGSYADGYSFASLPPLDIDDFVPHPKDSTKCESENRRRIRESVSALRRQM